MKNNIQLTQNMSIYSSDESKLGNVKHIVVDPSTSEVSHIVIEQGFIFTTDKVLPIQFVDRQVSDVLYTDHTADELDLRDFEETYYVKENNPEMVVEEDDAVVAPSAMPTAMYYYPPVTSRRPGSMYWGMPARFAGDPLKLVRRTNVPDDSMMIKEGAKVFSRDGDHVGDVYSVYMDEDNNRMTHFIISQGLLFQDYKSIPTFWVEAIDDDGLYLAVTTDDLEQLPAFKPETA